MRLRVLAQGSTLVALVAGALATGHATSRKSRLEEIEKNQEMKKSQDKAYPWQKNKAKVVKEGEEKKGS